MYFLWLLKDKENRNGIKNVSDKYMAELLHTEASFDIVSRDILIGNKNAIFYFVDGFCKDVLMQKLLQFLMGLKAEDLPSLFTRLPI